MAETNPYKKYEPIFGSWYITRQIGHGSIGRVYEIERNERGITYKAALKVITIPDGPEDIQSALANGVAREDLPHYYNDLIDKFAGEFRNLAKLKGNSYVVNYEDHMIIENEDGLGWDMLIKTELLVPLVTQAIDHPLTEADVLILGIDICRALKFCSQYGIIHRDIKPENILIAPSGDYKLGDFGIAKVMEETQMSLSRKGTYKYMSPEAFHGKSYGQTSDIYSLGLVMYKYLNNGRDAFMPPYPEKIVYDDTEEAFSRRISGEPLPEPAEGCAELKRIVLKACEFDRDDRYQTPSEMLEDLERLRVEGTIDPTTRALYGTSGAAGASGSRHCVRHAAGRKGAGYAAGGTFDKGGTGYRIFMTLACLLVVVLLGVGTYTSIPKEVTDITGIEPEVELYYDASLKPDYAVEPKWFEDEPITFVSDDESVFTVTDTGEISAVKIGEAELEMRAKEYNEKVRVAVVPKVTDINGIEKKYSMTTGDTLALKPTLKPKKFKDEPVTFKSKNKDIAKVSEKGVVTAMKAGSAVITISAGGTKIKTSVEVADPAPVVYYNYSSGNSGGGSAKSSGGGSNKSKKSSGSGKKSGGYFESGDDEYF